jgi:predicted amidohydrolase
MMQVKDTPGQSVEERQRHLLHLAECCLRDGADLVFMTEAFQYKEARQKTSLPELIRQYAEPYKAQCAELARRYNAYVVPWDYELDADNRVYNTSYILDRSGREIGRYRKSHLTWSEVDRGLGRGTSYPVFELDFGKVGIMICYDNYFPETARLLGINGAELILYPLFDDMWDPQWEIRTRSRAIDNLAYVAACKLGHGVAATAMYDPLGELVCKVEEEGAYQVCEIELGKPYLNPGPIRGNRLLVRKYWAQSRNVGAYGDLLKPPPVFKREEYVIPQDKLKEYGLGE